MNILLINPYDYNTVQSNPGLLSLLHVLRNEKIKYAITVIGSASNRDFNYIEMPEALIDTGSNNVNQLLARIKPNELTHIIAIDSEGAMVAMHLLKSIKMDGVKCSYISYEILFSNEIIFQKEQILKEYDLAFLSLCNDILIQDEVRGAMFCKEVGLTLKQYHAAVSPHQYLGKSSNKNVVKKSLGLPLDKKILIYSGSLSPYAKPDWWIRIAESLPQDYIFLFTCFDGKQYRDQNVARISKVLANIGNVFFVRNELPISYYMQVLQACDVGIALFRPIYTHWMNGQNIRQIGLSSGKFCNYVSCGLPVICDSNQDQFRKLAENYPNVQTITTPEEVPSKLKLISEMGDDMAAYCSNLFNDVLNPYNGIKNYLENLT